MNRVILTGDSGFIGQHLHESLLKNSCKVYSLCREELSAKNKSISESDFFDTNIYENADTVIHLVGAAHNHFSGCEANYINFELTKKVFDRAVSLNITRFIFLSSANMYKECIDTIQIDSQIEVDSLPNTIKTKLLAEQYIQQVARNNDIEVVIIRSPLVYGENVKANFASLMKFVGKGLPLPFRLINNKRSLVSVYNLVDFIQVCISHPRAANQVFFVSDDHDLSTAEMVALMAKVQNKKNLAIPVPVWCFKLAGKLLNERDVIDRLTGSLQLDITHTKNTLNWKPPYSVEHGFKLAAKKLSKNN
jgi:nucleoside-diphosphate-sugar epimerase